MRYWRLTYRGGTSATREAIIPADTAADAIARLQHATPAAHAIQATPADGLHMQDQLTARRLRPWEARAVVDAIETTQAQQTDTDNNDTIQTEVLKSEK